MIDALRPAHPIGRMAGRAAAADPSQAGLTVAEIMVVLVVIAITAVAAIPLAGSALDDMRARGAAQQVATAFRQARQAAISTGAIYQVTLGTSTIQITCTNGTPAGNTCPPNRPPNTTDDVTNNASVSATVSPVSFQPTGAAAASMITVTYPNATNRQVEVRATGSVRVCQPTCT